MNMSTIKFYVVLIGTTIGLVVFYTNHPGLL